VREETVITSKLVDTSSSKQLNNLITVWQEYKQEHSQSAMEYEFGSVDKTSDLNSSLLNQSNRKFAIGYYSCPFQGENPMVRVHFTVVCIPHLFSILKRAIGCTIS
jgi:hypothetical protein